MRFIQKFTKNKLIRYGVSVLLLFPIFLLMICSISVSLGLGVFHNKNVQTVEPIASVEFNINSINKNNFNGEAPNIVNPNTSDYLKLAMLPEVKSYELNFIDVLLTTNLKDIQLSGETGTGLFNIKGVNNSNFYDMRFDNVSIYQGRTFTDLELDDYTNDNIIISDIIAKKNNLKVGDVFDIKICNPSNADESFSQKFTLIGTFIPKSKIGLISVNQDNLISLIHDFINLSHADHEDHTDLTEDDKKHAHTNQEVLKTDFESIETLQKIFLSEDLNTFFVSNKTAEKLNELVAKHYGNKFSSSDYQASFVLNSTQKIISFKNKAKKILPEYFTVYNSQNAYNLWMPNAAKSSTFFSILSIVSYFVSLPLFLYMIVADILNDKKVINQYRILGLRQKEIAKKLFLNWYTSTTIIIFGIITVLAPFLAKYIIFDNIFRGSANGGYYYNIQKLTRNIIDFNNTPKDYMCYSIPYFTIISLILITFLVLSKIVIHCLVKKSMKEVVND